MKRLLAIGISLGAALALPGPLADARSATSAAPRAGAAAAAAAAAAAQTVSGTVGPSLGVSIAPDGTVSTGSSTVTVSVTRQRIGGVLVVTVAPME